MKRLMLCMCAGLGLLLSGCSLLAPAAPAADPGSAVLSLKPADGYKVVRFDAGKLDANLKLTLSGVGLAVNDPSCKALEGKLVCKIGLVKANAGYVLAAKGVVKVEAEFTRPNDATVYKLATD